MTHTKTCFIVRGLPGSGKSTFAKTLMSLGEFVHCEADMFQVNKDGEYDFRFSKIQESHDKCYDAFVNAIADESNVIVSNTFVNLANMQRYIDHANDNGYVTQIVTMNNLHSNKSIHDVPQKTVDKMRCQFQHYI